MSNRNTLALVSHIVDHRCTGSLSANNPCAARPTAEMAWHNAVLSGVLRRTGGGGAGTLRCHPAQQADVADWLRQHDHLGWRIEVDTSLSEGDMKLSTASGEIPLRW